MIDVDLPRVASRRSRSRAGVALATLAVLAVGLLSACGSTQAPSSAGGQTTGAASSVGVPSVSPTQAGPASGAASASSSATAGGPGDIAIPADPCRLLSTAELQAATGVAFPAGQKTTAGPTVECDWAAGSKTVYLTIGPLDAKAFAVGKSVSRAVRGVGDDAYAYPKPLELHVADVNLEVTAQVSLGGDAGADSAAELAVIKVALVKLAT
ncbi:MAG TPA: hypothetical protein VF323_09560 [Candidatus Limnocylindrales bacterium]